MYKDVILNYSLFNSWKDVFIPLVIIDIILLCNSNNHEKKNYTRNLNNDNLKNDLDIVIVITKVENNYIYSRYVYSNVGKVRQNLSLKLLSTIANIKVTNILFISNIPISIISYCSNG